jgi:hypothetical protein
MQCNTVRCCGFRWNGASAAVLHHGAVVQTVFSVAVALVVVVGRERRDAEGPGQRKGQRKGPGPGPGRRRGPRGRRRVAQGRGSPGSPGGPGLPGLCSGGRSRSGVCGCSGGGRHPVLGGGRSAGPPAVRALGAAQPHALERTGAALRPARKGTGAGAGPGAVAGREVSSQRAGRI